MKRSAGFSLVELLASVTIGALLMAGAVKMFRSHAQGYTRHDLTVAMQDNLRVAMENISTTIRGAGNGVPTKNLSTWISWFSGFTTSSVIIQTSPPGFSVARCGSTVATISSPAAKGAKSIQLASAITGLTIADSLDTNAKSLIVIDDDEPASVTGVSGARVDIDTNVTMSGAQGLVRSYPVGTAVCRIDVSTFTVVTNANGQPELQLDTHQGAPAQTVAQGVNGINVAPVVAGQTYRVSLTAQTLLRVPDLGTYLTGGLQSDITLRN